MKLAHRELLQDLKRIQQSWDLTLPQMAALLHMSPDAYSAWLVAERENDFERMFGPEMDAAGPLISFHRRLAVRYPRRKEQIAWLFSENPDFAGAKPIDIAMSSQDNLVWLNYYLGAPIPSIPKVPNKVAQVCS